MVCGDRRSDSLIVRSSVSVAGRKATRQAAPRHLCHLFIIFAKLRPTGCRPARSEISTAGLGYCSGPPNDPAASPCPQRKTHAPGAISNGGFVFRRWQTLTVSARSAARFPWFTPHAPRSTTVKAVVAVGRVIHRLIWRPKVLDASSVMAADSTAPMLWP